jgi:translation initiation factor 2 subunit 1
MKLAKWPLQGELVVCTVKSIEDFGIIVELEEYQKRGGFIHLSEITSGWVKHIRDYAREGQKIVCKVLRVEKDKAYIALSLKQVTEAQKKDKIQEWKAEKKAEKLLELVAEKLNRTPDSCYKEFGYKLIQKYGSLYLSFESAAYDGIEELKSKGFKGDWLKSFVEIAKDNITLPLVEISQILEIGSERSNGVEKIKEALLAAEISRNVTVRYIGAPRYRITVKAPNYKLANQELEKAFEFAKKIIKSSGGWIKFIKEKD